MKLHHSTSRPRDRLKRLQIIEARHLTVPADVLHAFFTMDASILTGLN